MGGKIFDRPSSDEASLLRMKLSPGSASEWTRAAFRLSPVFSFSGDEPLPENAPMGSGVGRGGCPGGQRGTVTPREPPLLSVGPSGGLGALS